MKGYEYFRKALYVTIGEKRQLQFPSYVLFIYFQLFRKNHTHFPYIFLTVMHKTIIIILYNIIITKIPFLLYYRDKLLHCDYLDQHTFIAIQQY